MKSAGNEISVGRPSLEEQVCRHESERKVKQLEKENSELKKLLAAQLLKAKALEITLGKNS